MRHVFVLAAGLLASTPALATPGWDEPSNSPFPQAELSYGAITSPSPAQQRQAAASANVPAPNGAGNVTPNGPVTANPPGAGASSSATLQEHGETGTGAVTAPAPRTSL